MSNRHGAVALPEQKVVLTHKQASIYRHGWYPNARFRYAVCGRRFGKTYLLRKEIRRAVRLAVAQDVPVENEIWYGAPTFKQAKRVFWGHLKRSFSPWMIHSKNESDCSITLVSGHIVRIVGLDNYEDLRGSGLWFFAGDEWADAKIDAWSEVIRPMLSTCAGHALFIGTPKGFNHFYKGYVEGQPGATTAKGEPITDTMSWLYTTLDGGNVPQSEVEQARRTLNAKKFRQEYEAGFESFEGRVYYAFSRLHSVREQALDTTRPIYVGMDFNINPMSATVWQEFVAEDGSLVIHQIDEIVIPTSNTNEMADEIVSRYAREGFSPGKPDLSHISIFPDPAGAQRRTSAQGKTDISILAERGFKVFALQSHPLVRDRINIVNSKFETADGKRHAFVDPRCVQSIECYERLAYKEGTSEPDKDSGYDHLCDASGYMIFGRYSHKPIFRTNLGIMGR